MKKQIMMVLLVFVILFGMAGCGSDEADRAAGVSNISSQASNSVSSNTEDSSTANGGDMPQAEQALVPVGEWADVFDSSGEIRQIRITNVTWDNDAGKTLVEEYNANSVMIEIQDLIDEYPDIGYYIYDYEVRYPDNYPVESEKNGIYFFSVRFGAEKSESGWYTSNNTYIVSVNSTYDATGNIPDIIMPGDTVQCKGFGTMIDQYKDEFYLSVSYKDPADGDDASYKDMYFAVK